MKHLEKHAADNMRKKTLQQMEAECIYKKLRLALEEARKQTEALEKEPPLTLGNVLTQLRKINNISPYYTAEALNINPSVYIEYETLSRKPELELLKKISEFFNVSMDSLLQTSYDDKSIKNLKETIIKLQTELDQDIKH